MKPTIGRIVHYHAGNGESGNVTHPHVAAVVTAVWTDTCVNLTCFFDGGPIQYKTSVVFGSDPFQWSWPERTEQ